MNTGGIINGGQGGVSIGSSTTWGVRVPCTMKLPLLKEGLKANITTKESEALSNREMGGREDIMAISAGGSVDSYVTPDSAWLKAILLSAFGTVVTTAMNGTAKKHLYTPITAGPKASLPAIDIQVDRIRDIYQYVSCKLKSLSISAKPKDYLVMTMDFAAHSEEIFTVKAGVLEADTGTALTVVIPTADIVADGDFVGNYFTINNKSYLIDSSVAATGILTLSEAITVEALTGDDYLIGAFPVSTATTFSEEVLLKYLHGSITIGGTTYDEIEDIDLNFTTNMEDDKFRMNGSQYMNEVEPQKREATLSGTADFTNDMLALEKENFKKGVSAEIILKFQSDVLIPGSTDKYALEIRFPNMYIKEAGSNIEGASSLKSKFNGRAAQIGTDKGIEVSLITEL